MTKYILGVDSKDVLGFNGAYTITNEGVVISNERLVKNKHGVRIVKSRVLNQYNDKDGYKNVKLSDKSKVTTHKVHTLVLESFVCKRPERHQACHLNGKRDDNRLENLSWGTPLQNAKDKKRHGTEVNGERNGLSKLKDNDVREIRKSNKSHEELAKIYGVRASHISKIRKKKAWKHII
jgi:hypothetical protein